MNSKHCTRFRPVALLLCLAMASAASGFAAATITTDKNKYSLGEPMVITGTGFAANLPITVSVLKPDKTIELLPAVSGATGAFQVTYSQASVPGRYKITATDGTSTATAASTEADVFSVDFRQCSNNNNTLGACNWINSILQQQNSVYYEGMSTLQRLIFDQIVPTGNNVHTLKFHVDATKAGHHAFDFITSWEAAIAATNQLQPPPAPALFPDLTRTTAGNLNACGDSIDAKVKQLCLDLRLGTNPHVAEALMPSAIGTPSIGGNVSVAVMAYMGLYGSNGMRLYANLPISNVSLAFNNYDAPGQDQQGFYTLTWTSASTSLLVEFGAHIAVGESNVSGLGYGKGLGASFISGGPYHVSLDLLDGGSIGNQDNQLKGSDILIPAVPPTVVTTLHNQAHATIPNFSSVAVGTIVHDTVTVTSPSSLNPIPAGSTATFHRFTTFDCTGSSVDQTVSVPGGSVTATVESASFTPLVGSYSFNANFLSGNTSVVTNGVSTCEPFRVVDASIAISPLTATNPVNQAHTITATVTQNDGTGSTPAPNGTLVTFSLLNNTAGATFVSGVNTCTTSSGICTVQINTSTAGGVDIRATTTFSVGGASLTRTTGDGLSGDSANAHKDYVNAKIAVTPLTAVNAIGQPHTITATVQQDDGIAAPGGDNVTGFGSAPTGTLVTFSLLNNVANATFVGGVNTCTTTAGGTCSVKINSTAPGGVDIHATTTFSVGGVSLTRATGTGGLNGADAHKSYVGGSITINPTGTNEVGHQHIFTIVVTQDANGNTLATTANISATVNPAPGSSSTTCGASVAFNGNTATCTLTINNPVPGVFTAHATASFTISGATVTRSTDGTAPNSGDATKTYVDARIAVSPLTATNAVGQPHIITATVSQDPGTGFVAAPNGTLVTFSLLNNAAGATFVGGVNTCTTTAGSCFVQINSTATGGVDIHATTTFSVGGVSLTRATGTGGLNGADAHKSYVGGSITINPSATNEVGQQHIFTIVVTQDANGNTLATTANISATVNPAPGSSSTTCGAAVAFTGNTATCTLTINNPAPGAFTAHATASFTISGATVTRSTNGTAPNSGDAIKTYVNAKIAVSPLTADNPVNQTHTITATVQQDDGIAAPSGDNVNGFGAAPNGTLVTFSLLNNTAGANFVGGVNTCTTTGGTCSVQINSSTPGGVDIHATTTFSVGNVSMTRATGTGGVNGTDAHKNYVTGTISITPTGTNPVGQPHVFTITAAQTPGAAAPATTANITYSILPAGFTLVGSTCGAAVPFSGNTVTCTVTINSAAPGVFTANATAVFTVGGATLTRTTNALGGNSGPAVKTYVAAVLRIKKVTAPGGDSTLFTFTPTGWNGGSTFQLKDGQTRDSGYLPPATYLAEETVPNTFVLTNRACVLTGTNTAPTFTLTTAGVSVLLLAGEDVTCTFTNSKLPTLIVKKTILGNSATFNFTIGGNPANPPNQNIALTPNANSNTQSDSQIIQPGTYLINEVNIPSGWLLTDKVCTSSQSNPPSSFVFTPSATGGTFTAGYGDNILCSFVDNQQGGGATRTQGFWATHTVLTNAIWNGTALPPGTGAITPSPVIGSVDAQLCTLNPITAIGTTPPNPFANQVMGGFWANISNRTTNPRNRNDLDQTRMQFLQQYLAAVLNVHAFGTPIPGTTLAAARTAYCATDAGAIKTQMSLLAAYNTSGDTGTFTPGASATPQDSRSQANIPFWDITLR
jgi:hypothetical protein